MFESLCSLGIPEDCCGLADGSALVVTQAAAKQLGSIGVGPVWTL